MGQDEVFEVIRAADSLEVTAEFPLDMRDYGIKPPVRALVLRVAPDVVVDVRLTFAAGLSSP